ncbi:MAG: tyrosine--tRNA ligase [Candidatus Shikimatogenerans bostrichidophilus]|nr:MAG: tyrosine--tRNA ligase [Candidatus Shikimatogenerans bostrichidophilus]
MLQLIKDLKWRNLIYNKTKNINKFLNNKKIKKKVYMGIDPTSNSLHIGHLLGISLLLRLNNIGYKILIVIGGATAIIGDLNEKNKKIKLNKNKIKNNINIIKLQILKIFKKKKIIIINNYKWIKKIYLLKFLKKITKKIYVNNILKFKIIKHKIKNNKNIKLSEFIYHVLQGYDYLYLNKKKNYNLQIGGSDQWNNILTGIKIIKKIYNKDVYGLTFPLLLKKNGEKFSKSNKKNIWIDKKKTSIYNFYQYFINLSDIEAINYIKYFYFKKKEQIKKIIKKHKKNKKKKILQNKIAKYMTKWIHGKKSYKEINKIIKLIFIKNNKKYKINKHINIIKKHIKNIKININSNNKYLYIYDIIKYKKIFKSNTEYKKYIINNGIILINNKKIKNNIISNFKNLFLNKYLIIKKGKKKHYLVIINKKNK